MDLHIQLPNEDTRHRCSCGQDYTSQAKLWQHQAEERLHLLENLGFESAVEPSSLRFGCDAWILWPGDQKFYYCRRPDPHDGSDSEMHAATIHGTKTHWSDKAEYAGREGSRRRFPGLT